MLLKQHSFNYSLKLIKLKQVVELTLNTCGKGNAPAIFYDRRELFCPRILSFRSDSCWVRLIFLGSPPKAYQRKGELASAWDLQQAKPIRGRHKESILILILRKDFIKMSERGTSETRKNMPPDIFSKDFQYRF